MPKETKGSNNDESEAVCQTEWSNDAESEDGYTNENELLARVTDEHVSFGRLKRSRWNASR